MKRLIFLLLFISISVSLSSQITPISSSVSYAQPAAGSSYEAEYQLVLDDQTTEPSASQKTAYNTFVKYLVDNSYWDRIAWMQVARTPTNDAGEALINWKTPGTNDATDGNSTAFTTLQGFAGDGSTDYINSNFNIEVDSSTIVGRNDFTILLDLNNDVTEGVSVIGAEEGSVFIIMAARFTGPNTFRSLINNGTVLSTSNASTDDLAGMTRTGPTAREDFFGGSSLNTGTSTSTDTPNLDIYILAVNDDGSADNFSTNQYGLCIIMDGISEAEYQGIRTAWITCKAGL